MKKLLIILFMFLGLCSKADTWSIVDSCSFLYVTMNNGTTTFIYKPNKQNIALSFDATYLYIRYNAPYYLNTRTLRMDFNDIATPTVASAADAYGQVYAMVYCTSTGGGGEDLAATLVIGNATGGTDIQISTGDELNHDDMTADRIAYWDASKNIDFLNTATYPSLAELAHVKGVTSAIQTQLNAKVPTTRSLTINGSAQDLSADRTWTITTTGTLNRISVAGGTGLTPTIDIDAAYVGQNSITTVGTLTTGTIGAGFTAIANARLANSTISGVALGANLADLTATNATITFSGTYNGSTARSIGLNLSNANTWLADVSVPDEAYGVAWNGSVEVPTKNAVYDKIEAALSGGFATTSLNNIASVAFSADLVPDGNETRSIGSITNQIAGLWLGDGSPIFLADNNVQISADVATATLTITGLVGGLSIDDDIFPTSSTKLIGTAANPFGGLRLVEGATISWDAGDAVMTQTNNDITFSSISTFQIGTATTFTTGNIELNHASATTLSGASGILSVEGVPILKASSGVAASATASGTTTVTHNLGRAPVVIEIYGMGDFTNNTSAVPTTSSIGVFSSSGNTCIYQPYDPAAVTTAEPSATSTAFAIAIYTSSGNFITGVIGNVTSTQFDIVWTETGTHTAGRYLWKAW